MSELLQILLLVAVGVYFVSTLLLFWGLYRLRPGKNREEPSVSVIIPARDEAKNIEACLASVLNQDYPHERYEVIVVDDESRDETYEIAKSALEKGEGCGYKLIRLTSGNPRGIIETHGSAGIEIESKEVELSGKKRALTYGIEASKGEILLFTDADCEVGSGWIRAVVSHFEPEVDLVLGFTFRKDGDSLWQKLYSLESLATATISGGSIGWSYPITGSASNLAYRRSLFDQLGGFKEISSKASGDDTLFLQKAYRLGRVRAKYMTSPDSFVTTQMPKSLAEVLTQRLRRLRTTLDFSPALLLLSALVFLFYLLLVLSPTGLLYAPGFFQIALLCLGAKFMVDLLALYKSTGIFRKRYLLKYLPILELVYPPFFVYCSIASLISPAEWKGRKS
jgi:cellulose synthase/poly-beta-1,6-N-acetylglucosamine synthase-like glycosyltransferase